MKQGVKFMVVGFLLFFSLIGIVTTSRAQIFSLRSPLIGKTAPDFTLATMKGGQVNLKEHLQGERAIVFFWATWCPHCRDALKDLNRDAMKFNDLGIKIVLVDIGEDKETVLEYAKKNNLAFDILLDERSAVGEQYGVIGVPMFFFVNKEGVIKDAQHSLPKNFEEILS